MTPPDAWTTLRLVEMAAAVAVIQGTLDPVSYTHLTLPTSDLA